MTRYDPRRKILTPETALRWRAAQPGRLVFTNGVFDLLHPGHVDLLTAAHSLGDRVLVGLNSDASVRRLKGPARPLRGQEDRAVLLAALESVDAVVVFEEDTPLTLIRALRPEVLVKGGDYSMETVVGANDVVRWGGDVVIIPLTPGYSTTATLDQLQGGAMHAGS